MTKTVCQTPFKFVPEFNAAFWVIIVPFGNCIETITLFTPLELSVMLALNVRLAGLLETSTVAGVKLNDVIIGACVSCANRLKHKNIPKIIVVTAFKMN